MFLRNWKDKLFGDSGSIGSLVSKTKKSERNLVNNYETMDSAIKSYHRSYDEHLKNLMDLDDFANMTGMESVFKDIILKKHFKHGDVDKTNPLFFSNYLIEGDVTTSSFRKEHILQQVRYVLKKYFAPREHQFIKDMTVEVGKHSALISITTIEHHKHKREIKYTHDKDFILKFSDLKQALKDIIASAKKHLKDNEKMLESSSNSTKSSKIKSKSSNKMKSKSASIKKTLKRSNSSMSSVAKLPSKFGSNTNTRKSSEKKNNTKAISIYRTQENKNKEKQEQGGIPTQGYAPQFAAQGPTLANRTAGILQQPTTIGTPAVVQSNVQCETITDPNVCRSNYATCYVDRFTNQCKTKGPQLPRTGGPSGFGGPTTGFQGTAAPPTTFAPAPPAMAPNPFGALGTNAPKLAGFGS